MRDLEREIQEVYFNADNTLKAKIDKFNRKGNGNKNHFLYYCLEDKDVKKLLQKQIHPFNIISGEISTELVSEILGEDLPKVNTLSTLEYKEVFELIEIAGLLDDNIYNLRLNAEMYLKRQVTEKKLKLLITLMRKSKKFNGYSCVRVESKDLEKVLKEIMDVYGSIDIVLNMVDNYVMINVDKTFPYEIIRKVKNILGKNYYKY